MLDPEQAKLESEVAKGDEYQRVFQSYVGPFIEAKRQLLFEAFQEVSVSNVDQLKDIKLQLTAINSLEAHFQEFMNTGKLAKKQLEKE